MDKPHNTTAAGLNHSTSATVCINIHELIFVFQVVHK